MRRELKLLGAAASHNRRDKESNIFHSYRGPLFVVVMLMVVWAIGVHVI
jgi:hypothetical protein